MISLSKGDIWLADLPAGMGHEQEGSRPILVLADVALGDLGIAVPFTTTLETEKFKHVLAIEATGENGLDEESVCLIFQIRSLDKERFSRRLGKLDKRQMDVIDANLADLLKLKLEK